jgi:hypothetical protein
MNREERDTYQEIVRITSEYLGPAGQRFVDRHIKSHLKKNPSEVTSDDIENLVKWIKASMSVLTNDQQLIEEHSERILKLATNNRDRVANHQ